MWSSLYPSAGAPASDPDGDGQPNLAEAQAGTDPTDPASRFITAAGPDAAGNLVARWPSVAGKHYLLETSADLSAWTTLPGEYIGTGAELSAIVRPAGAAADSRSFWRVVVFDAGPGGSALNDWESTHLDRVAVVTASAGANGSISPAGSLYVAKGDTLAFTITPTTNYSIDQVLVDGLGAGTAGSFTFSNIQAPHTISASFKLPLSLDVTPSTLSLNTTATLAVSSNVAWTAGSSQSWLAVTPSGGTGNATLTVSAPANTTGARRRADITVTGPAGSGLTRTIATSQTSTPINLALGKPATASSSESTTYAPARAVDGDTNTRWSSTFIDPQWLMVDLGFPCQISTIELVWETAYAKAYKIQTSLDNITWSDMYSTTASPGGTERLPASAIGRYVRMHGTARSTQYGYSLKEFRVLGTLLDSDYLQVSPASLHMASIGGSATTQVSANVAWTASSDQPWVTINPASGTGNATITLTAADTTIASRSATVTLQSGSISEKVVVLQTSLATYYFKNRSKGTYMYDGGSHVLYGASPTSDAYIWIIEDLGNGRSELKIAATGHYIHIQDQQAWAQCGARTAGSDSSKWTFEATGDGYFRFRSSWQTNNFLHVENQAGYVQQGAINTNGQTWQSAQWAILPTTDTVGIDPNWRTRVTYIGRFDQSAPAGPRFAWSNSTLQASFTGTTISLQLARMDATADNFLNVRIDGGPSSTIKVDHDGLYSLASTLAPGTHSIEVSRRDEGQYAELQYQGFAFKQGQLLTPPPHLERRIEVIGASVTCGYGDEAPNQNTGFSTATENAYLAFGPIAARQLNAEVSLVSWSGKGVYRNNDTSTTTVMPVYYPLSMAKVGNVMWDFSQWIPQVVVINLGGNDFSPGVPDRTAFVNAYKVFLSTIRSHYPTAHIFCTTGPLLQGSNLTTLREYVQNGVVTTLNAAGDARIHFLEFPALDGSDGYGADWHPSLARQQKMGDQLTLAIRNTMGW